MIRQWIQTTVVMVVAVLVVGPVALGQSPDVKEATAQSGDLTAQEVQSPEEELELAIITLQRVAKANKYAFVFFFRADDERTQSMRKALESGMKDLSEKAEVILVDVTDPLESSAVKKFGVSRAPMPLLLAVAPTGAITKNWFRAFDGKELVQAFVSTGESKCLKALQSRKMVLVCVQNSKTTHNDEAMKGVNEFKADRLYAARTAVVSIDPADKSEADFLKKLRVSPKTEEAVTVLMAPPGRPIATFNGATKKADIVVASKKAGAGCDPKSGCCPQKKPSGKKVGDKKPVGKKPSQKKP